MESPGEERLVEIRPIKSCGGVCGVLYGFAAAKE